MIAAQTRATDYWEVSGWRFLGLHSACLPLSPSRHPGRASTPLPIDAFVSRHHVRWLHFPRRTHTADNEGVIVRRPFSSAPHIIAIVHPPTRLSNRASARLRRQRYVCQGCQQRHIACGAPVSPCIALCAPAVLPSQPLPSHHRVVAWPMPSTKPLFSSSHPPRCRLAQPRFFRS